MDTTRCVILLKAVPVQKVESRTSFASSSLLLALVILGIKSAILRNSCFTTHETEIRHGINGMVIVEHDSGGCVV